MENTEHKFLIDGTEVSVEKQIEGGFLIRKVYEYDEEGETHYGHTEFVEAVFDKAPTEKLDASIKALQSVKSELEENIRTLKGERRNIQEFIDKTKITPELRMIIKYFTLDFKWMVKFNSMSVYSCNQQNINRKNLKISLENYKAMMVDPDTGYNGSHIAVFDTKEEAENYRRDSVLSRLRNSSNIYHLDEAAKNFDWRDIMETEEAKEIIATKRNEFAEATKLSRIKNARENIEKCKKELAELGIIE